jgi:hypothetical protein
MSLTLEGAVHHERVDAMHLMQALDEEGVTPRE